MSSDQTIDGEGVGDEQVSPTPGPWTISVRRKAGYIDIKPTHIYIDRGRDGIQPEDYANAHLIVAAPDLLEACKIALKDLRTWSDQEGWGGNVFDADPTVIRLRAAIAKAEGSTHAGAPDTPPPNREKAHCASLTAALDATDAALQAPRRHQKHVRHIPGDVPDNDCFKQEPVTDDRQRELDLRNE